MNWTPFMHGLGIVCLLCIAAIAIGIVVASIFPNWTRIWDTACGRPWALERHPASPTALILPLRTGHQLSTAEADGQPTHKAA